jgi:hypothetical protein
MLTIVIALKALIELGLMFCLVRALASALLPPSGAGGALLQVLGWTLTPWTWWLGRVWPAVVRPQLSHARLLAVMVPAWLLATWCKLQLLWPALHGSTP